jgi:hypothetical protein
VRSEGAFLRLIHLHRHSELGIGEHLLLSVGHWNQELVEPAYCAARLAELLLETLLALVALLLRDDEGFGPLAPGDARTRLTSGRSGSRDGKIGHASLLQLLLRGKLDLGSTSVVEAERRSVLVVFDAHRHEIGDHVELALPFERLHVGSRP